MRGTLQSSPSWTRSPTPAPLHPEGPAAVQGSGMPGRLLHQLHALIWGGSERVIGECQVGPFSGPVPSIHLPSFSGRGLSSGE